MGGVDLRGLQLHAGTRPKGGRMERIDIVCRRPVEEGVAQILGLTTKYHGEIYYFCSEACMDQFRHEPELYAAQRRVDKPDEFGEEARM